MGDENEYDDFFGNDDFEREPSPEGEEAVEVNENKSDGLEKVKKPRRVMNPRITLNEQMLVGPKGIPALRELVKDYKPNPKANPYDNLNVLMKKYAHWGHLMFPKSKFEDVINRCETLGTRRQVKVYMMKSRLGMPLTDEDFAPRKRKEDDDENDGIIDDGAEEVEDPEGLFSSKPEKTKESSPEKEIPEQQSTSQENLDELELMEQELQREAEMNQNEELEDELLQDFEMNNDW